MKPSDAMSPAISGEAMMAEGCCISYDDYLSASSAHQGPVAFFFKASWCHICQQIDQDLTENPSRIPAGVTIVGVDYDANTELREKY